MASVLAYNEVLFNIVPFKDQEEALWALRVDDAGCTLDLFGLAVPHGPNHHTFGDLRYVVRGQGTRMFDIVSRAEKWWERFRSGSNRGRPLGTGTWRSADDFEANLRIAVHSLRVQRRKVTQEEVAGMFFTSDRQLRTWLVQYGVKWKRVLEVS